MVGVGTGNPGGVAYVPGIPFYSGTPDVRTLRLSFVTATAEEIDRGIAALAQTVREAAAQVQGDAGGA